MKRLIHQLYRIYVGVGDSCPIVDIDSPLLSISPVAHPAVAAVRVRPRLQQLQLGPQQLLRRRQLLVGQQELDGALQLQVLPGVSIQSNGRVPEVRFYCADSDKRLTVPERLKLSQSQYSSKLVFFFT